MLINTGKMSLQDYLSGVYGAALTSYNGKINVNISADGFDGFVIPDGTTFMCRQDEFNDACQAFSQDKTGNAT